MMKVILVLSIGTIALAMSCSKPSETAPDTEDPSNKGVIVYVSGDSFNTTSAYLPYPVYWKNGKQFHLPHPGYAGGSGIALSDSDVFVSSTGEYSGNNVTYWKNTTAISLQDPKITYPVMRDIVISGNNLYTLGIAYVNYFDKIVPVYWKNQDTAIKISTYAFSDADAQSIAVDGNDIYIAGSAVRPQPEYYYTAACYWKNGTPTFLHSSFTIYENGLAKCIKVVNKDVHVVGETYRANIGLQTGTAYHWKNNNPTALTGHDSLSYANDLMVVGSDIYIAGAVAGPDKMFHAAYWKNGVLTVLDSTISKANGICVFEGDIYVVGDRSVDLAVIWKNGVATVLGRGRARAIAIKRY